MGQELLGHKYILNQVAFKYFFWGIPYCTKHYSELTVLTWFDIPDSVKLLPDPAVLQPLFVIDGIDAWKSQKAKFKLLLFLNIKLNQAQSCE